MSKCCCRGRVVIEGILSAKSKMVFYRRACDGDWVSDDDVGVEVKSAE